MGRGSKPAKSKEAKPPTARKSPKDDDRVRDLEKELAEARKLQAEAQEQQAATAEILRVISSSPTDPQPVFDTIAEAVVRLCDGVMSGVYRFDGTLIHFVAHHNWTEAGLAAARRVYPKAPDRDTQVATAILDRAVIEVRDFENDSKIPTTSLALARALGYRSDLVVPMLLDGNPIGAIAVAASKPDHFRATRSSSLRNV